MPLRDPLKTELLFRAQMTPPLQLHTAVEVQEKSAPLVEGDICLFLGLRQTCRDLSTIVRQITTRYAGA